VCGTKKIVMALTAAVVLSAAAPAAASAPGGLAPTGDFVATNSVEVESLVRYTTKGKIKAQKRVRFLGVCSVDCTVTGTLNLKWPGPNLVTSDSGSFPAGQLFEGVIKLTKAGVAYLKENKGKSKYVTKIQAVDPLTGNTDTDQRTFKFK
jgi:hypothetical protein